jgi:hypothetical protein
MTDDTTDDADDVTELDRLHRERHELAEKETELLSHDHGGGLPADDQNRLERVRERWADVDQEIQEAADETGPYQE